MKSDFQILSENHQYIQTVLTHNDDISIAKADKTLVIMIHDFPGDRSGHDNLFMYLESLLLKNNYHVMRFDFRGCGKSQGQNHQFTLVRAGQDVKRVTQWAEKKGYKKFIFICEGLGTSTSIFNYTPNVKAMVMFWPVFDLKAYGQAIQDVATYDEDYKHWIWKNYKIGAPFMQEMAIKKIQSEIRDLRMPIQIFQGAKDKIVSSANVQWAKKHILSKRLECTVFQDEGHGLTSEKARKSIYKATLEFLQKNT